VHDFFEKLFLKNENWTFLKMSKSENLKKVFHLKKHALLNIIPYNEKYT